MGKTMSKLTFGLLGTDTSAQEKAAKKSYQLQEQQAKLAEEANNKANAREPDIDAIKNENASGIGSTMLSGVGGVDADSLDSSKKKKTLLGA